MPENNWFQRQEKDVPPGRTQGSRIQIWLGGGALPPDFPINGGRGKIAPEFPIIGGGQILKIPTYLYIISSA